MLQITRDAPRAYALPGFQLDPHLVACFPDSYQRIRPWGFSLHYMHSHSHQDPHSHSHQSQPQNSLIFVPRSKCFEHNGRFKIDLHLPSFQEFIQQHVYSRGDDIEWINLGMRPLKQITHDGRTHCLFLWDRKYRMPLPAHLAAKIQSQSQY